MPRTPPEQITLSEMAGKINALFDRYLDEPISQRTPYDWWKRTKNGNISEPLPDPVLVVGRQPVFKWNEIKKWFISYRGIGTRVGVKAEVKESAKRAVIE